MTMRATALILLLLIAAYPSPSYGATLFYLHGKVVEDQGDLASHPTHGIYKYNDIVSALTDAGHNVFSEVRPKDTVRTEYAQNIVDQINTLIENGTDPAQIVVVGFSKGAQIAALVSNSLKRKEVRFVIQAVCGSWVRNRPSLKLGGDVYSMYEKSDSALSCVGLFNRSGIEGCEVAFDTGLSHGLFFQPREVWIEPMLQWISSGNCRLPQE